MSILRVGVVAALALALLLAGCQQPGQVVSSTPSVHCPCCHEEVVTSRIKGINFTRFACPDCEKEFVPPEGFYDPETIVYHCPGCKAVVATCPACSKKALPPAVTLPMRVY